MLRKYYKGICVIFTIILLLVFAFISLRIHMAQLQLVPGNAPSDLPAHVIISQEGWVIYSGIFLVINRLYVWFGKIAPYLLVLTYMIIDLLAVVATTIFLKTFNKQQDLAIVVLESILLNMVSTIELPEIATIYIRGNIWGNITYAAMKPFALLVFLLFIIMREQKYEHHFIRDYLFFIVTLTIATGLKPSFTISFIVVMGSIIIYDFIKKKISLGKSCMLAMAFLPSFYLMVKQYIILFQGRGTGETVINIGYMYKVMSDYFLLMLLLSLAFPLSVYLYNLKTLRQDMVARSTLYFYGISFLIGLLFAEDGYRQGHGNYLWGIYFATFLCFVDSFRIWIANVRTWKERTGNVKLRYLIISAILLVTHFISGTWFVIRQLI